MPRIVGVNIPDQEKIDLALTRIYGVGQVTAKKILEEAKTQAQKEVKKMLLDCQISAKKIREKFLGRLDEYMDLFMDEMKKIIG